MFGFACSKDNSNPVKSSPPKDIAASVMNQTMARGINFGNALEAPNEGDWGVVLQEGYFKLVKDAGFSCVRIPICWTCHARIDSPYTIDRSFFNRIDWAVNQAFSNGLVAIINMHNYDEIFSQPDAHRERFLAIWRQISDHYKFYKADLLFEFLNEPHDALTASIWNELILQTLQVVREKNPTRNVVIGPVDWNNVGSLSTLKLPESDQHIIVTFHYYNPFQFTHQGAEWVDGSDAWLGTSWKATRSETLAVIADFSKANQYATTYQRPIFMGEFGSYSKANEYSRVRWTKYVARKAEEFGFGWAYWEFGAGFGVYDRDNQVWREDLLEALIPKD
jgi:endoglucanase